MAKTEEVELVVIGAGYHGLCAAKTYLDVHPSAQIIIYESASSVGGTWAIERLYPGLRTNNQLGNYEHSDFPLSSEKYGVPPGGHVPGEIMHRYFTDFAVQFKLDDKIRFNAKVETAEHQVDGGWLLSINKYSPDSKPVEQSSVRAAKLIVATGFTSEPSIPEFPGQDSFEAPMFHFKDIAKHTKPLETAKNVCVLGGAKSGRDTAYGYASKGITVDWVIRKSGHGPIWMAPPRVTPLKQLLEQLTVTRLLTWFSPCIWGAADGFSRIRGFLHQTRIGRVIVDGFWNILKGDVFTLMKFDSHPEIGKLKPWTHPFFIGPSLGIVNYETDFFDLIRNGAIRIHIEDITSLRRRTVNLSDGTKFTADALICCTGWKHVTPLHFLPEDLDLGLPHVPNSSEPTRLLKKADTEILSSFPRLKDQPKPNPQYKPLIRPNDKTETENFTPYRLYRFMVPPSLYSFHDLAFAGCIMSTSTSICAELQALWIAAYFTNKLALPSKEKLEYETILHSRFGKWRCPSGYGDKFPDLVFDALPYYDLLCADLGVERYRKGGGIAEVFKPYNPKDYKGVTGEWMRGKNLEKVG